MYEHRTDPLLTKPAFAHRMWRHFLITQGVVGVALAIGILGYHLIAGFAWIDSLLNASMLLGGMGPVGEINNTAGKVFASIYALLAGLVLIAASGILLAPLMHRILHRIHLEGKA